ncbi:hypothetical protein BDY24DRAFT_375152 [Mrakia frigida]|uniref:zinc finger MYND domain-containing protein n=1 Tax=Mrakia frigida TaxID=29902 RepID=UPI003FCC0723
METQSVAKLAQLLRLSSGGTDEEPEGRTGKSSAQVDRIAVQDHLKLLYAPGVSDEVQKSFAREFASQYLLSLVHRCTLVEVTELVPYHETLLVLLQHDDAYLPRFVRKSPEEACSLYLSFVADLPFFPPPSFCLRPLEFIRQALTSYATANAALRSFIIFVLRLIQHLSTNLPSLPPPGSAALLRLATRIRTDPSFRQTATSPENVTSTFLDILDVLIGGEVNPRKLRGTFVQEGFAGVWWTCELQVKSSGPIDGSRCTQLKEGEEMMQCSRCLSVRYCSKEHQRADWKRHKKLCFKPTW